MTDERVPPHSLPIEQATLGGMLLAPDVIEPITAVLTAGDFYKPAHATIYKTIVEQHGRGEPTDALAITQALAAAGDLERVGGAPYLHTLIATVPTAANTPWYARQVARYAAARRLVETGTRLTHLGQQADLDHLDDALTWARNELDTAAAALTPTETAFDSWAPVDLDPALTGGVITQPPALLARSDGEFLLYAGRIHSLSGEPEAGKTWVALAGVLQAIHDRQHVIYLDFEDTPEGIIGRLLAMGARPDWIRERLHYIRPDRPIDTAARGHIDQLIADHFVSLAVIDGVTEAMTMHGLDPYNNPDAAKFYEAVPRYITRHDGAPAVLLIDHVPKDEDRPKRYAIGAQHKLAGLDGAAFVVDIVKPFAPGQPGVSKIRVAKDRPGQVRKNARGGVIAEMHVSGDSEVVTVELRPPSDSREDRAASGFRPTVLMQRVSQFVEVHPGASRAAIEAAVKGKRDHIRLAIELLHLEGYLRVDPGPRNSANHHSLKQFRNDSEEPTP